MEKEVWFGFMVNLLMCCSFMLDDDIPNELDCYISRVGPDRTEPDAREVSFASMSRPFGLVKVHFHKAPSIVGAIFAAQTLGGIIRFFAARRTNLE